MGHGHHHHRHEAGEGHGDAASRKLGTAFALNLLFTAVEIVGGLWTNSVAILSDALHDAGDSLSLGLAWYLQKLSGKGADARFTYGYRRFSSLGALITGVVLLAGLGFVLWNAVQRLAAPEAVHAPGMLALAVLGVLFNGAAAWRLSGGQSLNEKVARWHLLEDMLGWVAVLVGAAVMMVWDLPIIDPLLAMGISVIVLFNVFRNLRRVVVVFLQGTPAGFDPEDFDRRLRALDGVLGTHHTHTWTLDGERHVLSTHLVMRAGSSREAIVAAKLKVHELLRAQQFAHVTVDVELEGEPCGHGAGEEPGSLQSRSTASR